VFGSENVQIVVFDDFKSNTAEVYRKTCGFLGVEEDFQPQFKIINPRKRIIGHRLHRFIVDPPETAKSISGVLIPYRPRKKLLEIIKYFNTRYKAHGTLDLELKRKLQVEFAWEIEQLSKLIDRDLSMWMQ
jgi:hypothetical protein